MVPDRGLRGRLLVAVIRRDGGLPGSRSLRTSPVFPEESRIMLIRTIAYLAAALWICWAVPADLRAADPEIKLSTPSYKGTLSVEEAISVKKTVRYFARKPLTEGQVGQILWAANGDLPYDAVSGATAKVIPSAGGLYALEVFLITGNDTVTGIPAGVYSYVPKTHSLKPLTTGDQRNMLAYACLGQTWLSTAPALVVIGGVFPRTTGKYGPRGFQYVFMEAGNSDQNVYLQAAGLGLKTGTVGAFQDDQVKAVLKLPGDVTPLLVIALGM
jgi:SagB-type dehydrogenase family enzyme